MKGIDITLVKDNNGLFHPFGGADYEKAAKIPAGETYQDEYVFRKVMEMRSRVFCACNN